MKQTAQIELINELKPAARLTKKEQIVERFKSGVTNVRQLARETGASLSYVASVLQQANLLTGYFDLYTTTANPMNGYSHLFVNKLGFRNEATARRSVAELDNAYREFEIQRDRAGQHHALEMALIMFNRARWTNKLPEAEIFRQWLIKHLDLPPMTVHQTQPELFEIERAQ